MAIVDVKKITAIVLKRDTRKVLRKMQGMGVLEIKTAQPEEEGDFRRQENQTAILRIQNALSEVRTALSVITRYDHSKKSFLTPKPAVTVRELNAMGEKQEEIQAAIDAATAISAKMNEIRQRSSRIHNIMAQLEPFSSLDIPVEEIRPTAHARFFCGYIPQESLDEAQKLAETYEGLFVMQEMEGGSDFVPLFAAAHASVAEDVRSQLKELSFSDMKFDGFRGTVAGRIGTLRQELEGLQRERLEQEKLAEKAAGSRDLLLAYEDYLNNQLESEEAYARLGATERVNIIEGYIRHYDEEALKKGLSQVTEDFYLRVETPAEDDADAPTVIENKKLLRPFEAVTDMYSTPARTGIDPVYVLAPFYFIFFGMMLSDAAYGILLSIGALIVLKVKKPTGMFRQVTGVLAICGVSTLIWGALFGSWFGLEGIQPILFSPLSAPLPMLILCISIGYLHILTALGTGFYMLARDGKIWDAIFDKGFWIITLLAVPALLLDGTAGLICACVGLGGLILTQGRAKKGIVKKLIGGLASVYDITGYLSDLLSYSRIFGMALATAVIAMVFNRICGMLAGNVIGFIFAAAIFAVGHVFNIGINSLGAYVHSSRLQYIESFNKFFEGGGRAFRPLAYRTKNFRFEENDKAMSLQDK